MIVKRNETNVLHPLVQRILEERGYTVKHEFSINRKRVDFYAERDNEVLLVECKIRGSTIKKTILQLKGYAKAYGKPCELAVALPSKLISQNTIRRYAEVNIQVLPVDSPVWARPYSLYDPGGRRLKALTEVAKRENLLDNRGLPSASQALAWLVEQDAKRRRPQPRP